MPLPTSGTDQSGESNINDLLGVGLATATETPNDAAEDTSVADVDNGVQGDDGQDQGEDSFQDPEAGADDAAEYGDEGEAEETAEGEDAELDLEALQTDYAESAYQKAAEHWKNKGVELNLKDPGQRAMLKDWLDRGRDAKSARSELEAMKAAAQTTDKPADKPAATETVRTHEQMMQERLSGAEEYAKTSVVPEVAMKFATRFINAMWPGKGDAVKQEQANELAQAFTMFGSLLIADAIPSIVQMTPQVVAKAYPQLDRITSMADRESAVEEIVGAMNAEGQATYPGMDRLIESGAIKRLMNGPELKDAVFEKDPYKNMVAKMKVAYKMARGQRPNPQALAKAVQRGRTQAKERARAVGAGRTPPGNSRPSGFARPARASVKDQILSPGKGGFHALLREEK